MTLHLPITIAAVLALALVVSAGWSGLGYVSPAAAQTAALTKEQAAAVAAYDKAVREFKAVLAERRAQIDAKQALPERPGQAVYLARREVMSTYKDLTDALPSRIGRGNKFGVPPAYFDAAIEPLIDEYTAIFKHLQTPPSYAQASETPFKDVADLGRAIARAKGLDAATVDAAGRISLGIYFAETNGNQNIGNARSNTYKGSLQTGVAEDRKGRAAWAGAQAEGGGARRGGGRARRQGDQARRQRRPALQSLDRGAQRPDERARRPVRADPGHRQDAARRDRPDEGVPAHPADPDADALSARVRQLRGLSHLQPDHHGLPAQQFHLQPTARWTGRRRRRPSARSSMGCGCSTTSSCAPRPGSRRSRPRRRSGRRGGRLRRAPALRR